ncbi:hypothetical protein ACGF3K_33895 [Streptomyces sp. NPDC047980]|uniref:hypothetical protein n=1 Tax=Streptomyces sp. NPDC047980 TaxID=3365494 RepID=UPI0037119A61
MTRAPYASRVPPPRRKSVLAFTYAIECVTWLKRLVCRSTSPTPAASLTQGRP